MAIIKGPLQFTGTMGSITAYQLKGSEKVILRQRGGPNRDRIKHHPVFENTRLNNQEWKAVIMAGSQIRYAMQDIRHIKDYNSSGPLHKLCKAIQLMDTIQEKGKRPVLLSKAGAVLEGFSFNLYTSFEELLRHPVYAAIDRITGTATLELPDLLPGVNFYNPSGQPLCRFTFILGAASDIIFDEGYHIFRQAADTLPRPSVLKTDWRPWRQKMEATTLQLQLDNWQSNRPAALLLSAGIEFGIPVTNHIIEYAKRSGSTKLLKVV